MFVVAVFSAVTFCLHRDHRIKSVFLSAFATPSASINVAAHPNSDVHTAQQFVSQRKDTLSQRRRFE